MKSATRISIALLVMLLWAVPSQAQDSTDVTFQVDMTAAADSCQLVPEDGDVVEIRGSLTAWDDSAPEMSDDDGDNIYSITLRLPIDSTFTYKFWSTKIEYEDDTGDRSYTVEAGDPVLDPVEFADTFSNICGAGTANIEIEFRVDMSVAVLQGTFDPETDIVTVAGNPINGWDTTADTLFQSTLNPDVWTGLVQVEDATVPSDVAYKFVIGNTPGEAPSGWESGNDRILPVTGNETDVDGNGFLDLSNVDADGNAPYYNRTGPDEILTEPATVTFEVDLRPAFYHLADSSELPVDTQSGVDAQTSIDGVYMNGPVAGFSTADEAVDWAGWGEELAGLSSRELLDDGSGNDAAAGDTIYTITLDYEAGAAKVPAGKFGINGFDNEGGFGADHRIPLADGATIRLVYGATLLEDGDYTDDIGPGQQNPGDYDPYIIIDNSLDPSTVGVVRRGGEEDGVNTAVEPVDGEVPTRIALGQNYPNPFNPSTTFEYRLDRSQHVTVRVYDLLGRTVATLVDGVQPASTYRVTFDGSDLASGVYIYQMQADGQVISKTMTLLK